MSEPTTEELIERMIAAVSLSAYRGQEVQNVIGRLRSQQSHLNNLLAVIHRDGGQHQDKVGTEQAVADAMEVAVQLREQLETDAVTVRCEGCDEQDELEMDSANYRGECGECGTPCMSMLTDDYCAACRIEELEAELREYRNAIGNPNRNYHKECNDLLAAKDAEIERLEAIIAKHDICHDLHGKVGRDEFEEGCRRAKKRNIYILDEGDGPSERIAAIERSKPEVRPEGGTE